jgi:diacylglycerol kinase (ATP)
VSELRHQSCGSCLVLVNPAAEGVCEPLVGELVARCGARFAAITVQWTQSRGEAVSAAAGAVRGGWEVVVAVGGDGTVREVAQGIAVTATGSGATTLFVVPAGTANSSYRSLWGTRDWREALDLALADRDGHRRRLDLAKLVETGDLVLVGACAGFSPAAIHAAKSFSQLSGHARYDAALWHAARTFEPYPGKVTVDGIPVHTGPTLLANIGGSRHRGGHYEVLPHSVLDDGLLDVCVIGAEYHPSTILDLIEDARHVSEPGVVYARGQRIMIERTDGKPVWFEHDGEVLVNFHHTFTLEVLPGALPVFADAACRGGPVTAAHPPAAAPAVIAP